MKVKDTKRFIIALVIILLIIALVLFLIFRNKKPANQGESGNNTQSQTSAMSKKVVNQNPNYGKDFEVPDGYTLAGEKGVISSENIEINGVVYQNTTDDKNDVSLVSVYYKNCSNKPLTKSTPITISFYNQYDYLLNKFGAILEGAKDVAPGESGVLNTRFLGKTLNAAKVVVEYGDDVISLVEEDSGEDNSEELEAERLEQERLEEEKRLEEERQKEEELRLEEEKKQEELRLEEEKKLQENASKANE